MHFYPILQPRRRFRHSLATVYIFFASLATAFLVIMALALLEIREDKLAFSAALVSSVLVLSMMFLADYKTNKNSMSPMCLSVINLFLLFPFHGFMMYDSLYAFQKFGRDIAFWYAQGLLVFTVSIPFLYWGYNSRWPRRWSRFFPTLKLHVYDLSKRTTTKLIVIVILGWLAHAIAMQANLIGHGIYGRQRSLGSIAFILHLLMGLPLFSMAWFLSLGLREKRHPMLWLGLGILFVELIWGLMSGSRQSMMLPLLISAAAISYVVKPFSIKILLVGFIFFLGVAYPLSTGYRTVYQSQTEQISREGITGESLRQSLEGADEEAEQIENVFESMAVRFHGLTSLSLIIRYTPERHPYLLGETYVLIPALVVVPRFLWKNKPLSSSFSPAFEALYWEQRVSDQSSIAMTQLGELWVNFHLFGTILGTFFFGMVLAYLFKYLRFGIVTPSVFPLIFFSTIILTVAKTYENSFQQRMVGLPKILVVYLILAWFLSASAKRKKSRVQ